MTFQISGAICKSKHSAVTQSAEQDAKSTWKAFMQHVLRLRSRWHLKSFYLAEPHVFLTITSIMMHVFCFNSTLYKFACLYEFNQSLCESLNKTNTNDPLVIRVQKRSSNWTMIANAAFGLCSLMASNVFGSLSDGVVNKRHLLGFISFGVCVCGGILIGVAGQTQSSLMMPVGLFIFQLLSGLIASSMVLISTANGYLSVVTEKKDRALRFSCLELSFLIGSAIGNAAVGVTVQKHGTKVAIGLSCGLSGLALLYSLVN